jgi:hypothetical protein
LPIDHSTLGVANVIVTHESGSTFSIRSVTGMSRIKILYLSLFTERENELFPMMLVLSTDDLNVTLAPGGSSIVPRSSPKLLPHAYNCWCSTSLASSVSKNISRLLIDSRRILNATL